MGLVRGPYGHVLCAHHLQRCPGGGHRHSQRRVSHVLHRGSLVVFFGGTCPRHLRAGAQLPKVQHQVWEGGVWGHMAQVGLLCGPGARDIHCPVSQVSVTPLPPPHTTPPAARRGSQFAGLCPKLRPPHMVHSAEGGEGTGKESLWLLEAPVRKIILQMHNPARTGQCWGRQTRHGLEGCIWMHLVNGTGNSPSPGRPTLE